MKMSTILQNLKYAGIFLLVSKKNTHALSHLKALLLGKGAGHIFSCGGGVEFVFILHLKANILIFRIRILLNYFNIASFFSQFHQQLQYLTKFCFSVEPLELGNTPLPKKILANGNSLFENSLQVQRFTLNSFIKKNFLRYFYAKIKQYMMGLFIQL